MKKTIIVILALFVTGAMTVPAVAANRHDFKIIQAAVKKSPNPEYVEGREVRWFKVLITDSKSSDAKVKLTLPIALIELILSCDATRHVKIDNDKYGKCEVDLKALWMELKKAGPMAIIEIEDEGAVVKVWLE
ncbi:MAG: hypothetical protein EHM31_01380 [Candidatus Aminicenantes bacterium]|nr:MAG: hypothetical protein EHM31_05525 [Candidatus Aminicenantes bacterium]RPJ03254.1 MAG: hypothetical protein EHM31_01380 [Candidatus Aminicenantes bacterium]